MQPRRIAELEDTVRRREAESAHVRDRLPQTRDVHPVGAEALAKRWDDADDGGDDDPGAPGGDDGDDARSEASAATSVSTVASTFKLNAAFFTSAEMEPLKRNMTRTAIVDRLPELRDSLEQRVRSTSLYSWRVDGDLDQAALARALHCGRPRPRSYVGDQSF